MVIRAISGSRHGAWAANALRRMNDRHPWSHNDVFHTWITTQLPDHRADALDVGCGRGELLAVLAERFERVHGTDADAEMRRVSAARCAGLPNVTVDATQLDDMPAESADLVTMIAVLHHLDLRTALLQVHEILRPAGRFACVGLARPETFNDHAWEVASMVTNPIIGFAQHPWAAPEPPDREPFPVRDPQVTFGELRSALADVMPGAQLRHRLGFRHTIAWSKPG
ncbi:class I SAM-dependent methyltransferase [Flexivirga sp. ID2601S]|uniref:Class I SAM-dependent methyltransferase n=2 Tax=Flexivirga aerilata TaxID=1656889 RepID=A0A849AE03_9MICO|nr:class I SAM-dependent methyltransferase [Flexivirga aerilata]